MARMNLHGGHMICWVLNVNTDKFLQPRVPEQEVRRNG